MVPLEHAAKTADADAVTAIDIVVGVDPAPGCRPAVSWAVGAARVSGRRVALVRVVDLDAHRSWLVDQMLGDGLVNQFWPALRREIDHARAEAGPGGQVRGMVLTGRPTSVMTRVARHADQVVIGVEARSMGARLVLGSMAHHLLRTSPGPVVLVPLVAPSATDLAGSGTERVVVAVGGATGAAAIRYAFSTAHDRGLPLVLLHAKDQDGGDAALGHSEHLYDVIAEQQAAFPDVETVPLSVAGNVETAVIDRVGVRDLLVVGNREVDLPTPPLVDRVLMPMLRHPHQVVVVVPDRSDSPGPPTRALVTGTVAD